MEVTIAAVADLLKRANRLVLTPHIHPDGDCLGSMLGLYDYLIGQGKEVIMLLDDDIPASFAFLPHIAEIQKPAQTVTADLLIVVDASDEKRLGAVKDKVKAPILNIDHHISNTHFADYWLVDSQAAATAEIIYGILKSLQAPVTAAMAVCLYTGLATDSGFFRYSNTSPQTMRFGAELIEYGAKPHIVSEQLELRQVESLTILAAVLQTLEFYEDGRLAMITVCPEFTAKGSDYTEGLVNYPRSLQGVDVAAMFKIVDDHTVRISLRSKGVDVSQIALELGGGGHARAAGCTFSGNADQAKAKIRELTAKQLKKLS